MPGGPSSTVSPTVARSHSSSSHSHSYRPSSSDNHNPHRARSVAVKPASSHSRSQPQPQSQLQPQPQSQEQNSYPKTPSYERRPPADHSAPALSHIPNREIEPGKNSRREVLSSRPEDRPLTGYRTDSTKRYHHKTSSVHSPQRNSIDMAAVATPRAEGFSGASQNTAGPQLQPVSPSQPKKRGSITTPSGHWALGKTIGAGSMGKVKLAKNIETGEQVKPILWCPLSSSNPFVNLSCYFSF